MTFGHQLTDFGTDLAAIDLVLSESEAEIDEPSIDPPYFENEKFADDNNQHEILTKYFPISTSA